MKIRKLFIYLICFLMLFSVTGCKGTVTGDKESGTKVLTPGTYTATGNGHNGPITVETVIDEEGIKSVEIIEQYESDGVQQVINKVQAIVKNNQLQLIQLQVLLLPDRPLSVQ